MKKIIGLTVVALALSVSGFAEDLTGYISDAHCGAKHDAVSDANTKCIDGCMKHGSAPVLVKDGKVMQFDKDSQEKAAAYAGKDVKIDGSVSGDTVTISSIQAAQ